MTMVIVIRSFIAGPAIGRAWRRRGTPNPSGLFLGKHLANVASDAVDSTRRCQHANGDPPGDAHQPGRVHDSVCRLTDLAGGPTSYRRGPTRRDRTGAQCRVGGHPTEVAAQIMTDPSVLASFLLTYFAVIGYISSLIVRDRRQRKSGS